MLKGKIASGFEFEIDEKALDNMELVDAIAEADENPVAISRVIKLLLGAKQRKALYDHLRAENGNVPIKSVSAAVAEIFNCCGQRGKN